MKITVRNLKKLIREAVKEQLETDEHAAFLPDTRLKPGALDKVLTKLRAKKRENEERAGRPSTQKQRAAHKKSVRGMHIESGLDLVEQDYEVEQMAENEMPFEVMERAKDISKKYIEGHAHWMSLEDVYYEIAAWVVDPMEAVTILYNELNMAAQNVPGAEFGPVPETYKKKIQKAYGQLIDLAYEERTMKTVGV